MRAFSRCFFLFGLTCFPGVLSAQEADVPGTDREVASEDSALVAQLQEELNWRKLIRLRMDSAWFELEKPAVSPGGIDYAGLRVIEPATASAPAPRPIPLPEVLEIQVRKGHHKAGMIIGGIVSAGLGATYVTGLAASDGDGGIGPGTFVALAIFAVPGVVLGSFLGEAMYTWQPVYSAPAGPPWR